MTPKPGPSRGPRTQTQRRGDERRRQLLSAAAGLLGRLDLQDLTFAAVCANAGVPPGSARFFYPDIQQLLKALTMDLAKEHDAAMMMPFRAKDLKDWRALVGCLIERSARFHKRRPVFAKLTISGQTPPDLKRLDREADQVRSAALLNYLDQYFVLPRIPDLQRATYLATEVVDLAFTLSMNESGRITAQWLGYAKTSATVLLAHFFGGELKRRPTSATS